MEAKVIELDADLIERSIEALSRILADSVEDGASISFMAPILDKDAARFWLCDVLPEVAAGRRVLFGAASSLAPSSFSLPCRQTNRIAARLRR